MKENFWGIFIPAFAFAAISIIAVMVWASWQEHKWGKGTRKIDSHITRTRIIAVNGITQTITRGALTRAIAGDALAGHMGALIGALTAPQETRTVDNEYSFLVIYDTGDPQIEKVRESSPRFKFLLSKLEL